MTDDERAHVADDAVSNRSDDTALEEGDSGGANGQSPAPEQTASAPVAEEQSATDNEAEVAAEAAAEEAAEAVAEE